MDLPALIEHFVARAPAFAQRLKAAGLEASQIRTLDDLAALPVQRKSELVSLQGENPPFGGLLAVDPSELKGIYQSPGPIYTPEPAVPDAWRWASALRTAGFSPGERVLNAFGYHLSPAGIMFHEGLRAVGCVVVPGGVGNQEQQVRLLHQLGVTGYVGLPSYLKALFDKADALGLTLAFERAFVTAEPLPPSLRSALQDRGVTVRQGYGTAETGNLGFECDALAGWHVPDDVWIEICDLTTGAPLPPGEVGEVVVTSMSPHYALVRFGVGDLSSLEMAPCTCGRISPRLMGWQGRADAAVKVRGMFVHPRQLAALVRRFPSVTRWQGTITREDHKDRLVVRVEAPDGTGTVASDLAAAAPSSVKIKIEVEVVPPGTIADGASPLVDSRRWE
ncbi:MAG: AMP-binding protein [Myxococcota bacterium]